MVTLALEKALPNFTSSVHEEEKGGWAAEVGDVSKLQLRDM